MSTESELLDSCYKLEPYKLHPFYNGELEPTLELQVTQDSFKMFSSELEDQMTQINNKSLPIKCS
jgi:hypothetical protein